MDESQHSNYFQFFEWMDKDGNDTNIYARLRENKARPLLRLVCKLWSAGNIILLLAKKRKMRKLVLEKDSYKRNWIKWYQEGVHGLFLLFSRFRAFYGLTTDPLVRRNYD